MMFNFFNKLEKRQEGPLHPDFKTGDGFWFWNYTDFGKYIKENRRDLKFYDANGIIKIAFPFDDVNLLNNCPFMCKIGKNISSGKETEWFGVAYAYKDELEELKEFGKKFPNYKIITDIDNMAEIQDQSKITKYSTQNAI
ncbi:MAG: hypothetical protein WC908_03550 [Candidatus Paceibacterota bacterium]